MKKILIQALLLAFACGATGALPDTTGTVKVMISNLSGQSGNKEVVTPSPWVMPDGGFRQVKFAVANKTSRNLVLSLKTESRQPVKPIALMAGKEPVFMIRNFFFEVPGEPPIAVGNSMVYLVTNQNGDTLHLGSIQLKRPQEAGMTVTAPARSIMQQPGMIYYDAAILADPAADKLVKMTILRQYGYDSIKPADSLDASLKKLAEQCQDRQARAQAGELKDVREGVGSVLKTVGNYDVTALADGMARFLVSRVKEELTVSFFQHFKKQLEQAPTSDLKLLFPSTYLLLQAIDREIWNWDDYITALRDAFDKDLSGLVYNLEQFEREATVLAEFRKHTAGHVTARVSFFMARGFMDHVHAGQLLEEFDAKEYIRPTTEDMNNKKVRWITQNIQHSVLTLQLISKSLRSLDPENYWVNESELRRLILDQEFFGYYNLLMLLKAKEENICFHPSLSDTSKVIFLWKQINKVQPFREMVGGFLIKLKEFNSSYRQMQNAVAAARNDSLKARISYTELYPFIRSSVGILQYSNESVRKLLPSPLRDSLDRVLTITGTSLDILGKAAELGMDLSLRRYSAAFADLSYMFGKAKELINPPDMPSDSPVAQENLKNWSTFSSELMRYGTFMASAATAKSSEEVKEVINNYALPVGSSRIKRESAFNVSVNAYTGFFIGYERIQDVDPAWSIKDPFNAYGITAPLGIAVSIGQRECFKANWSYSLFASVIDLGAVTSFRFTNETVASVPTIHLQDILSPGLFFSIGIPRCPLSVNMGAQVGPNLRSITENSDGSGLENTYSDRMYVRYSISVVVDIPVFTLYNRTERGR